MKRPLANKRPFGPVFNQETGILKARKKCNPVLKVRIADMVDSNNIFDTVNNRARFSVDDIIVGIEEGEIGTNEPAVTTVEIVSDELEIPAIDINHMIDVMENKYNVLQTNIAASVEVDPDSVGIKDPFPDEFTPESTEVDNT